MRYIRTASVLVHANHVRDLLLAAANRVIRAVLTLFLAAVFLLVISLYSTVEYPWFCQWSDLRFREHLVNFRTEL